MILVLDCEHTTSRLSDGKLDYSPYNKDNRLVSVGYELRHLDGSLYQDGYFFFDHNHIPPEKRDQPSDLQLILSHATVIVAHNAKHDVSWLLECGFDLRDTPIYCTQIGEYVLLRGVKPMEVGLEDSAKRRGVTEKGTDLVKQYLDDGVTFDNIPPDIVEKYGRLDVRACAELYIEQQKLYAQEENRCLVATRDMMNEFCAVLVDMERNGICIDTKALDEVEAEYLKEKQDLEVGLRDMVSHLMGDTPVNLGSPEQLSQVLYSRKVIDKGVWRETFNIGTDQFGKALRRPRMSTSEFVKNVREQTLKLRKTRAEQCPVCAGSGRYYRTRKDGSQFKKQNICKECDGAGYQYIDLPSWAGLKLQPESIEDVSAGGFATDKETIERLIKLPQVRDNAEAVAFLKAIVRINAIDTYLSSFVGGIRKGLKKVGELYLIHPRFNQTVTSTGRLSSSDPNFQNQPRSKTFPIRKCIVSRFPGGSILEGDFSTLEFTVAGCLSGDPQIAKDIAESFDVHSYTASVLTESGQPTDRQGAKPNTFKPLYGGVTGTPAEQAYYKAFAIKYARVTQWHKELQEEAIRTKRIRLPSGREYGFPNVARNRYGGATGATKIKNYPVQGFATADLVPLANILVRRRLKELGLRSLLINTVHDSLVMDVYPGEERICIKLLAECMLAVQEEATRRWNYTLSIPLGCELMIGPNWLSKKEVFKGKKYSDDLLHYDV
jgi:DNA polymerase I-like protein with 3'-5' exonuclease and polymerase domains